MRHYETARTMTISAHPDDTETMLGYLAASTPGLHALVATDGTESTVNWSSDRCLCLLR